MSVVGIKDVETWLGKDLASLLKFEVATVPEKGQYIILRPKQFLGSDNFAKIAKVVREHNGEYMSQGKNSHFRVPSTTEAPSQVQGSKQVIYDEIVELTHKLLNKAKELMK